MALSGQTSTPVDDFQRTNVVQNSFPGSSTERVGTIDLLFVSRSVSAAGRSSETDERFSRDRSSLRTFANRSAIGSDSRTRPSAFDHHRKVSRVVEIFFFQRIHVVSLRGTTTIVLLTAHRSKRPNVNFLFKTTMSVLLPSNF